MTPKQIELARHALGLDGKRKQSYRNRFFAGPGHDDFEDWQEMVSAGFAKVWQVPKGWMVPGQVADHQFRLTRAGAEAALRKGERLCPEDFPKVRTNS